MDNQKTLVIGASTNPARYSNLAIYSLRRYGIDVVALAKRKGKVDDVEFITEFPLHQRDIHTVTMYVGPQNQMEYYEPVISLNPKRVIFNPGTENQEFAQKLKNNGIKVIESCTLDMLSLGQF